MLKYLDTAVTFQEVPDEVSLCINITNCPNKCEGCHTPELAKDIGKPLNWGNLNPLIYINSGITCVCFLGGDIAPEELNALASKVHDLKLKTCWYSGKEDLNPKIKLENFDYVKLGPYIKEFGPLNYPTTNQRFFKIRKVSPKEGNYSMDDITYKFWKKC